MKLAAYQTLKCTPAVLIILLSALWPSAARAQSLSVPSRRSGNDEVLFNRGLAQFESARLKEAEASFQSVLRSVPDDVEARYYLALTLLGEGQNEPAVKELDRLLATQPDFNAAKASRASALIRLKRYDLAQSEIDILLNDPATRATALSLSGQMLYDQQKYLEAAKAFEAARAADPAQAAEALTLQGLALYQAGQASRSRNALRQAAEIDLDPSLSLATRQLQSQLLEEKPKPFEFELSAGYEYDSNVGLFESGIALPNSVSHRDDGRFVLEPRARLTLFGNDRFEAGISTTNYFSYQNRESDFDISSYQLGPYLNVHLTDKLSLGIRYDFNYVEVGHEPFLTRNFVTPELTVFEKRGYTSFFYQFDARQYTEAAGSVPNSALDRDGKVGVVGIVQSISLPAFFSSAGAAELQLLGRYQDQRTTGKDYDGKLFDLGATLFVPISSNWKADLGIGWDIENYKHPNSLDFDHDTRHDCEFDLTVGLTRKINRFLAVRAAYSYTNHDSNVFTGDPHDPAAPASNPYEFSHHVAGIRMILTY